MGLRVSWNEIIITGQVYMAGHSLFWLIQTSGYPPTSWVSTPIKWPRPCGMKMAPSLSFIISSTSPCSSPMAVNSSKCVRSASRCISTQFTPTSIDICVCLGLFIEQHYFIQFELPHIEADTPWYEALHSDRRISLNSTESHAFPS